MMRIDFFKSKWKEIRSTQGLFQRVDPQHNLDFFIGIDEHGRDVLMLISDYEPSKMRSSKSICVEKGQREDGRWAIQIILVSPEREDVFARLCWDLVESTYGITNILEGQEAVISRFISWQRLMEAERDGLSEARIKGLIGELKYAENFLIPRYGNDVVIESWLGPEGADRDFVFEDTWAEVKAVASGKLTVEISSLEQLDTEILGCLVICFVDATSGTDSNGFSFRSIIESFRERLYASPRALFNFESKLVSLGYFDRKEYSEKYYILNGISRYFVDSTFPRLTTRDLRTEISRARYELLISSLNPWIIKEG